VSEGYDFGTLCVILDAVGCVLLLMFVWCGVKLWTKRPRREGVGLVKRQLWTDDKNGLFSLEVMP
jgi:uncharacterized iron-regulated membrane protein